MKERPILFAGPMVRAILDGSKTQTRRVITMPAAWDCIVYADYGDGWWPFKSDDGESPTYDNNQIPLRCPYGYTGDRMWVRESYRFTDVFDADSPARVGDRCIDAGYSKPWAPVHYDADGARRDWRHTGTPPHSGDPQPGKGRPSIHMPRWASRILLEIVSVRVERLNDISEADAWAEGIEAFDGALEDMAIFEMARRTGRPFEDAATTYAALWESINGAGSWDANPWVWVVEFKRVTS